MECHIEGLKNHFRTKDDYFNIVILLLKGSIFCIQRDTVDFTV